MFCLILQIIFIKTHISYLPRHYQTLIWNCLKILDLQPRKENCYVCLWPLYYKNIYVFYFERVVYYASYTEKIFTYCSFNKWFKKFKVMSFSPGSIDDKQIAYRPRRILCTNIISPRILRYLMLGTLIALLRSKYQIETQYSKCGLTKKFNKQRKDVLSRWV